MLVPFPFTDYRSKKQRPALVVSPDDYNRGPDLTIAFITSQMDTTPRPGDYPIQAWQAAGLPKPSLLRMKFATVDCQIVLKTIGRIVESEQLAVTAELQRFFG